MGLESIYSKVACISPQIEILLRQIYWNNVDVLSRFKPKNSDRKIKTVIPVNFNQIIEVLKRNGVQKGSLIIVHSSYDALSGSGLSPSEINDTLLELIGEEGTLAMPAIRQYKEQPRKGKQYLTYNMDNIVCTYNVQKTPTNTGFLPYYLMRRKGSVTSRHPCHSMTAYGPLAKAMMEHNLDGERPLSHGHNSSWKFCYDHNALVVGLGIDLVHSLSIIHLIEEIFDNWPVKDWYRERIFKIIDGDYEIEKVVRERKPKWGALYLPLKNIRKWLLKEKILRVEKVNSVEISIVNAQDFIAYLRSVNRKAFPYMIHKKDLL